MDAASAIPGTIEGLFCSFDGEEKSLNAPLILLFGLTNRHLDNRERRNKRTLADDERTVNMMGKVIFILSLRWPFRRDFLSSSPCEQKIYNRAVDNAYLLHTGIVSAKNIYRILHSRTNKNLVPGRYIIMFNILKTYIRQ